MPRCQCQTGLFLVDAAKVEQGRVLSERMGGVATTGIFVVGGKQHDGVFFDFLNQTLSVADVKVLMKGLVSHIVCV